MHKVKQARVGGRFLWTFDICRPAVMVTFVKFLGFLDSSPFWSCPALPMAFAHRLITFTVLCPRRKQGLQIEWIQSVRDCLLAVKNRSKWSYPRRQSGRVISLTYFCSRLLQKKRKLCQGSLPSLPFGSKGKGLKKEHHLKLLLNITIFDLSNTT